uniref:Uncharacterized protein n=1 Tax=Curvibacter symbiont subsp. Hydra magnipapillata TaxID=667019 RepID=C9YFA8_CURXX|nr:hypothetical protein Csp_D32640 [Curvibacter putative symbiont of Hydra magnipapillata]
MGDSLGLMELAESTQSDIRYLSRSMATTPFYTQRSARLYVALGVVLSVSGLLVLLLRTDIDFLILGRPSEFPSRTTLLLGLGLLGYGAAFLMLQYLRGGLFSTREKANLEGLPLPLGVAGVAALEQKIGSLAEEVASLKTAQLDALGGSRQELIETLRPTVHGGVADELEARFRQKLSQSARDQEIRESFATAEHRLRAELGALGRRSNLNLVIGVLTTSMAVGLLTYMVLGAAVNFDSLTSLLSHYIPRLGLVLFIEIFSFFFLRLYKATLAEMRLYQTDLSTLTIQHVAVVASLSTGDHSGAAALSKELLACKPAVAEPPSLKGNEVDPKALAELVQALAKILPAKAKND